MLVGINAQKLFVSNDYRNAGVSRFISSIVSRLPGVPGNERFLLYTNQQLRRWPGVEGPRLRLSPASFPTTSPVVRIFWEQSLMPVLALRDRVDVLHCPLNVQPVLGTRPVVLTIHDLSFIRFPERFSRVKQRYLVTLTRYSARRARRILTDSAATRDDVIAAFGIPPERVDVVYGACDPDFKPVDRSDSLELAELEAFRRRHGLPERVILYLATLEPRKNVDRLVHAYAELVRRGFPHSLVLAGGKGWGYERIFQAIEQHGLRDRVILPGYVSREEQPRWYNAADLFVYPSQYEGFGLPPLEAMACGIPVVTSNASSLPEVVGSAGKTVNVDDVKALADAMAAVLSDPAEAARMRDEGLQRAGTFTWEAAAARCVAAYRAAGGGAPLGQLARA
ncbi:MAG TPA: glycosyltransferase family 1 protein [Chloroflexota bacterium]|nr:glycosyltransferase family 1 protein [Chloroflexota bacterium]